MARYALSCQLAAPPAEVFAFCTRLDGFREQFPFPVRCREWPAQWHVGIVLDFRWRLAGIWVPHVAKVTAFEPGRCFVDEMTRGIYRTFRHTHCFESSDGGTRLTDTVEFSLGFGRWVDNSIGRLTLERTFRQRHRALLARFGAATCPT